MRKILSGLLGMALLVPVLYFSYIVGEDTYDNYFVFPMTKERYVVPTRWQDFGFLAIFGTTSLLLAFVSIRLIRFAMKPRTPDDTGES
jgi:hypothetical protein